MSGRRTMAISRAALLGRKIPVSTYRPPWALAETGFRAICDGCGKCVEACPEKILVATADNLVALNFDDTGCTFCGDCVTICPTGALSKTIEPALDLKAVVQGSCIALHGVVCRLCEEACEPNAIRFRLGMGGKSYPLIEDEACNGCGVCVSHCPNDAILMTEMGQELGTAR